MLVSKSEPLPEGTVIMAEHQFAGRGQRGNVWHTEPGMNLTFSLLLKPAFLKVSAQFLLNMMISIAVKDALAILAGSFLKVKWPNDLYYKDQKIGGLLIENSIAGGQYKSSIIGIGINVNQKKFDEKLLNRATSLYQILQQDVNLIKLLAEICSHIESGYLKLRSERHADLAEAYVSGLYRFNEMVNYKQGDRIIEGQIVDVTAQGLLVLLTNDGKQYYNFKEIEFI